MTTVAVAPVRRWIRRTRAAHRDRGETFGSFYFAVLLAAVVGSMLSPYLRAVFRPVEPGASGPAGASLVVLLIGVLYLALRRLGPLALSRPAGSWLLTAPVSRRRLLAPSLRLAAVGAGIAGALAGVAVVGHVAPRPVPGPVETLLPAIGALLGAGVLLVALAAQAGRWWGAWLDRAAHLLVAAGLAGLVVDAAGGAPRLTGGWPADPVLLAAAGGLALVVGAGFLRAVRNLAGTPNDRILEASRTAGTLADAAFGVEPSFVLDMLERRYWARRRLRSVRLPRRLPVLVAQDLLLVRRRPVRLLAIAGSTVLPVLLGGAPAWVLGAGVLVGVFVAAGASTATVRSDAANPVMLRMLGIGSRPAVAQRLLVPGVLAAVWGAVALTLLRVLDVLPAGPWWLLGLSLGPVGAVAAVRRARLGFVDNGLLPLDTPMGTVATGPVLASVIGFDGLLFGLPTVIVLALGGPLSWTAVLIQAVVAAAAVPLYLSLTTSAHRVALAERT